MFPEIEFGEYDSLSGMDDTNEIMMLAIVIIIIIGTYWKDRNNKRKFFEKFATREGFDPLVASNWYLTEYSSIKSMKVLLHYVFISKCY